MLVLEKSLIIVGMNTSIVSTIANAVLSLIQPFHWEGVFIPVVPRYASEIMQAPVPFIVGTHVLPPKSDIASNAAILNVDKLLAADNQRRQHSYTYLEMPVLDVKMPLDIDLRSLISRSHKILSRVLPDDTRNIQLSYFLETFGDIDLFTIKETRKTIERHNAYLCGDANLVDGWKKYGAFDANTGEYDFYPQWFMDHQRSILDFQEGVVKTQLFMSFMDRLRIEYLEKNIQR